MKKIFLLGVLCVLAFLAAPTQYILAALDTTAPTVGVASPLVATAGVTITISATYSDEVGVASCDLYVVDANVGAMVLESSLTSGVATYAYTASTAGSVSLQARCTDAAGNVGSGSSQTLVVSSDVTAPTIGAITPTTATQDTAVTFSATVTDASGIQNCHLFVDGSDQGAMTASGSLYSRSYTPASSGTLTAYASCGDTVGNLADGASVTVTVEAAAATLTDTTAPTVGAIFPSVAIAGESLTLTASVADSGGMGSCVVYVDGTNLGTMTIAGSYATYVHTFSTQGTAIANAYCVDAVGNATQGASSSITVIAEALATPTEEESRAVSEAAVGSLIKLACDADSDVNDPCRAVYYYDNMRHAFPNEKVFFTWYENFDDVIIVTADFMASITLSRNVTYHPGTRMVKFVTVNTVYGVGTSGELRAITSEDVAKSIWGSSWNTLIDDINDAFYGNYVFGASIDSTSDFDPTVVKESVESIQDIFVE